MMKSRWEGRGRRERRERLAPSAKGDQGCEMGNKVEDEGMSAGDGRGKERGREEGVLTAGSWQMRGEVRGSFSALSSTGNHIRPQNPTSLLQKEHLTQRVWEGRQEQGVCVCVCVSECDPALTLECVCWREGKRLRERERERGSLEARDTERLYELTGWCENGRGLNWPIARETSRVKGRWQQRDRGFSMFFFSNCCPQSVLPLLSSLPFFFLICV